MGSSCSFTAEFIQCISEANYLGGVANVKGVKGFVPDRGGKERFCEIYLDKYAKPNPGIGFPGALELITQNCVMLSVETNSHDTSFDGMETRLEERS
ncbi:hypothetical protein NC652_012646 [Populus alba x Populus x berolinensis]|nr:hypothetical protein NC652_012646 [Populus alba x Populus x berolinensis]